MRTSGKMLATPLNVLGYEDAILDGFNCVGTKTIPDGNSVSSHMGTMTSTRFLPDEAKLHHTDL